MTGPLATFAEFARCELVPIARASLVAAYQRYQAGHDIAVVAKGDGSPASAADRETELALRGKIEVYFPDHGISGEEWGVYNPEAEYVWVLDPLDGTRQFLAGDGAWGSLIAILHKRAPVWGCVLDPLEGRVWDSFSLFPASERKIARKISAAHIACTNPERMFKGSSNEAGIACLFSEARQVSIKRNCIGFAMVAAGEIDLAIESDLAVHDIAAILPLIWAAGGACYDLQGQDYLGRPLDPADQAARFSLVLSANPDLARAALECLAGEGR